MNRLILVMLLVFGPLAAEARIPGKSKRGPTDMLLVAGGDVAYPRGWMDRLVERMGDKMFDQVRGYAKAGDLAFVNLESPYTDAEFTLKKKWPIATPPHRLDYVLRGGFNMFSLANNHMGDAGKQGIVDTLDLLASKEKKYGKLFWTGAGRTARDAWKPAIFKVPGKRLTVVFHAFGYARTDLVPTPGTARMVKQIEKYRSKGDITIVSVHHWKEYRHLPASGKASSYRKLVDAGADVVLGHHPHVIQGVEAYKKGIIFHSLGNFSFASKTKRHHKTGARLYSMLPLIYFKNGKVERAEILPLYVNNAEPLKVNGKTLRSTNFQPQVLTGAFAQQVLAELEQWTRDLPGVNERALKAFEIKGDRAWVQVAR